MRKQDSVFVHSSRVHAYFRVVWVFVYFMLLCGLVKAVKLEFHSFVLFCFFYLCLCCPAEDTESFTKQDIGDSQKKYNNLNRWLQKPEAREVMQSFNQHQFMGGEQKTEQENKDADTVNMTSILMDSPDEGLRFRSGWNQPMSWFKRKQYWLV